MYLTRIGKFGIITSMKPGRPKEEKEYTEEDLFDEEGRPVSFSRNSKYLNAVQLKRTIEGEALEYNSNKGMYANMANPASYMSFYNHTVKNAHKGMPWRYPTAQALQDEVRNYFDFCIHRRIPICVAGLSAWLGISVATLGNWKRNRDTMPFYEVVEPAVAFIHSMVEQGAIDGNIPPSVFSFLAKNYHGLKDVQEYTIEPRNRLSVAEQDEIIDALPES